MFLFWPVAWWVDRWQRDLCGNISVPVVWYVPGACYLLRQAVRAMPEVGVRSALPFLIQSVYPKRHLVKRLLGSAPRFMITASEFNRSVVCRAGWPAEDICVAPPGKPTGRSSAKKEEPIVFTTIRERLAGRPFYLFLGPPTGIRGIRPLLRAFDHLAGRQPDICLVCLFRSDPGRRGRGPPQKSGEGPSRRTHRLYLGIRWRSRSGCFS